MAEAVPVSWASGTTWTFVITDKKHQMKETMTVVLTDKKGDACNAEGWRHAEILSQQPAPGPEYFAVPAYFQKGRYFTLNLSANVCDSYAELTGELTDAGVAGEYSVGGMFGGEVAGNFYGVQVAEPSAPNNDAPKLRAF